MVEIQLTVTGFGSESSSGHILDRGCPNSCILESVSEQRVLVTKLEPLFSLLTRFHLVSVLEAKRITQDFSCGLVNCRSRKAEKNFKAHWLYLGEPLLSFSYIFLNSPLAGGDLSPWLCESALPWQHKEGKMAWRGASNTGMQEEQGEGGSTKTGPHCHAHLTHDWLTPQLLLLLKTRRSQRPVKAFAFFVFTKMGFKIMNSE